MEIQANDARFTKQLKTHTVIELTDYMLNNEAAWIFIKHELYRLTTKSDFLKELERRKANDCS
jgi:hypothetical protein